MPIADDRVGLPARVVDAMVSALHVIGIAANRVDTVNASSGATVATGADVAVAISTRGAFAEVAWVFSEPLVDAAGAALYGPMVVAASLRGEVACELANILLGAAVSTVEAAGLDLELTPPKSVEVVTQVVFGKGFVAHTEHGALHVFLRGESS